MLLKAGARVNTPPLEANKIKSYADTPSACCGELHLQLPFSCIGPPFFQYLLKIRRKFGIEEYFLVGFRMHKSQ